MPFDLEKAAKHIVSIKADASTGKCARHVRLALEEGGLDMSASPVSAKDYGAYLQQKSFEVVPVEDYEPQLGDIVVIQPYTGGSTHGHIALFDGTNWVSDFVQRDMWGGPGYRNNKPAYAIYRYRAPVTSASRILSARRAFA